MAIVVFKTYIEVGMYFNAKVKSIAQPVVTRLSSIMQQFWQVVPVIEPVL